MKKKHCRSARKYAAFSYLTVTRTPPFPIHLEDILYLYEFFDYKLTVTSTLSGFGGRSAAALLTRRDAELLASEATRYALSRPGKKFTHRYKDPRRLNTACNSNINNRYLELWNGRVWGLITPGLYKGMLWDVYNLSLRNA